nr:hypothetical protein [uncultured Marinifilum sp.]
MNLNKKHRILAWLLSLALLLPIIIKSEHMMFPNHEHHCHSCASHNSSLFNICQIQDFDYFFFTAVDIIHIPIALEILIKKDGIDSTISSTVKINLNYSLRAPPLV